MRGTVLTVILNYRTADMTRRAAEAALVAMDGIAGSVLIVDNDSGDGSYARLCEVFGRHPRVRVIASDRNGGFGAGNNIGMRAGLPGGARPDYVYLLNSDAFPEPDAIALLRDHLDGHPTCGIAGSFIFGTDDAAHVTAFRFPSIWSELEGAAKTGIISRLLRRHVVPMGLPQQTQPVDWLAGASMMLRSDMLDRIGAFDETFFLYFEETDLCLRAARAGWRCDYLPASRVAHVGSESTGMKRWDRVPGYWFDSRWHYFARNHGRGYALAATVMHLAKAAIWGVRRIVQRKPAGASPYFFRDLVRHTFTQVGPGRTAARRTGTTVANELKKGTP